ncbi:metal binding domain of Ada-domain-containing protein [Staphylotrichum tortipilum]|uniref:Metal binding domain of Ada-domain-containing protein n=1 Tax=Staphylotrichum tortipilum TaxID=2831512 RepID=A0AAN6MD29_9PEZI|nr:metal binding domain of Ada-domain-containing protein [Staphylotrichum longicolle]
MPPQFLTDASRWHALTTRAPASHSSFIYAVTTTNIFCRPTCPSRLARRANILFFDTPHDAARAGFRACKRCRPAAGDGFPALAERQRATVRKACELMRAAAPGYLAPAEVASRVGWSARYFHGVFKRDVGVTPAEFARRCGGRREGGSTGTNTGVSTGVPASPAGQVSGEVGGGAVAGETPFTEVVGEGVEGLGDRGTGGRVGVTEGNPAAAETCVLPDGFDTLLDPLLFGDWQENSLCYPPLDDLEGVSLEGLQDWSPLWDEGYGTGDISPAEAFLDVEEMFNV